LQHISTNHRQIFVSTIVVQSLLISNVIICAQNVRLFLEHKPEVACATVWCLSSTVNLRIFYKHVIDVKNYITVSNECLIFMSVEYLIPSETYPENFV